MGMTAMEWQALLELNGMGPIHEAGERLAGAEPHRVVNGLRMNEPVEDEPAPVQTKGRALTASEREYIRLHYPHELAKDIAVALGLKADLVSTTASRMGVKKAPRAVLDRAALLARRAAAQRAYDAKRPKRSRHVKREAAHG